MNSMFFQQLTDYVGIEKNSLQDINSVYSSSRKPRIAEIKLKEKKQPIYTCGTCPRKLNVKNGHLQYKYGLTNSNHSKKEQKAMYGKLLKTDIFGLDLQKIKCSICVITIFKDLRQIFVMKVKNISEGRVCNGNISKQSIS